MTSGPPDRMAARAVYQSIQLFSEPIDFPSQPVWDVLDPLLEVLAIREAGQPRNPNRCHRPGLREDRPLLGGVPFARISRVRDDDDLLAGQWRPIGLMRRPRSVG